LSREPDLPSAHADPVQVWDTATFDRVYSIYSTYDIGDVFSVAYSVHLNTVYLGAQNASIQVGFLLSCPLGSPNSSSGTTSMKKTQDQGQIPKITHITARIDFLIPLVPEAFALLEESTANMAPSGTEMTLKSIVPISSHLPILAM
jgi:hypothetical protein